MSTPLLSMRDLAIAFRTPTGLQHAVQGISYDLHSGEVLGIVGESGSGKSVSSLAIMGLLPPTASILRGSIVFDGQDVLTLNTEEHRLLRATQLGMIFQNPMSSLNPYLNIATQMCEAAIMTQHISRKQALQRAESLLERVHIAEAHRRLNQYPHELSGGMCQRIMIAMTLMNRPRLLIADEPTTALDVTIQAQILGILSELLQDKRPGEDMSLILISHDIGVIANMADRIVVMRTGTIVEQGPSDTVLAHPNHPYTQHLFSCIPDV